MLKKLQNKLLLMNMVITSLVILGAFAVVFFMTYSNIRTENEKKVNSMSEAALTIRADDNHGQFAMPPIESDTEINQFSAQNTNSVTDNTPSFFLILNQEGEIVQLETFLDLPQETYEQAANMVKTDAINKQVTFYGRQWLYTSSPYTVTVIREDGQVKTISDGSYRICFLDITDSMNSLRRLFLTLAAVWVALLFVVFLISYFFARRSIRPIAEAWDRQNQFIADASHELKTPLAIIVANYDALLANGKETVESQQEWLDYMKGGTDRMTKLINSLLSLAKMEYQEDTDSPVVFDMSHDIGHIINSMDIIMEQKNLSLHPDIAPHLTVTGNQELVTRVFTILYENALKYADIGGRVEVTLMKKKNTVICSVANSGQGIDAQALPKIFDRFYRTETSRTEENGGHGLGLSIAKAAMNRLGGSLSVKSTEEGMTVFTMTI